MCVQLHFKICKETGVKLANEHWQGHVSESVETSYGSKVIILWNQKVKINRALPSKKPDNRIRD